MSVSKRDPVSTSNSNSHQRLPSFSTVELQEFAAVTVVNYSFFKSCVHFILEDQMCLYTAPELSETDRLLKTRVTQVFGWMHLGLHLFVRVPREVRQRDTGC